MADKEQERSELAAKLQKDLDDFVSQLKPKKYEDGWPEEKFEEEMEKHPFFMSKSPEEGDALPPLVEAIQQLKYDPDSNTPEELAAAYKEDGNQYFKVKKYRWAVESYTEAMKAKCEDNELNAQLYGNRAAAHFHIGNYKKSLNDCIEAKSLKQDYIKVIHRGALCCSKLKQYEECIVWCDEHLKIQPENQEILELKEKCVTEMKIAERDKRKAKAAAAKKKKEAEQIKKAIEDRGIQLFDADCTELSNMEPLHPSMASSGVFLDETECLVWPVMLLYPEYEVTDHIAEFHENSCLMEHLEEMFSMNNRPTWDVENKYQPANLQVYFGNETDMVLVDPHTSLKNVLSDKRYKVYSGTPSFFVTVKNSSFDEFWSKKSRNVQK